MRGMETREKMAGMEILVTGAGGFVGSALAPELVGRGHAVRAATRDPGAGEESSCHAASPAAAPVTTRRVVTTRVRRSFAP